MSPDRPARRAGRSGDIQIAIGGDSVKTLILNPKPVANCEGVSRRDVLKVGALSFFGLTLPQFLQMQSASAGTPARAEAIILLWCAGGPSHLDSFDPKPDAPSEV